MAGSRCTPCRTEARSRGWVVSPCMHALNTSTTKLPILDSLLPFIVAFIIEWPAAFRGGGPQTISPPRPSERHRRRFDWPAPLDAGMLAVPCTDNMSSWGAVSAPAGRGGFGGNRSGFLAVFSAPGVNGPSDMAGSHRRPTSGPTGTCTIRSLVGNRRTAPPPL